MITLKISLFQLIHFIKCALIVVPFNKLKHSVTIKQDKYIYNDDNGFVADFDFKALSTDIMY